MLCPACNAYLPKNHTVTRVCDGAASLAILPLPIAEVVLAETTGEVFRLYEDVKAAGAAITAETLRYVHEFICSQRYALRGQPFDRQMPVKPFPEGAADKDVVR